MEKLYHLVNGEFVHDGMPSVRIPTYAEIGAHIAILNNVGFFDNPVVAESVTFTGISNGKRNTEKQASLFDAIHAEILSEHNAEKARVRNRRKADRKYKLTPKMRKGQEYMRNWHVCMKLVNFGSWDDIPIVEGRVRSAEKILRADWECEQDESSNAEKIAQLRKLCAHLLSEQEKKERCTDYHAEEWIDMEIYYTKIEIEEINLKPETAEIMEELKSLRKLDSWLKYA